MRKMLSVLLICSVVLVSMLLIPTLVAHEDDDEKPMKPIRCIIGISLNWDLFRWDGVIDGDIKGEFIVTPLGQYFDYPYEDAGIWEVYWEEWLIETGEGTITVLQAGVWSFETFKFLSNGPVVDATGEWECLIGSTMYVSGVTTEFPVEEGTPVIGVGEMWIDFEDD